MKVRDRLTDRLIIECPDINLKSLVEARIPLEFKTDWHLPKLRQQKYFANKPSKTFLISLKRIIDFNGNKTAQEDQWFLTDLVLIDAGTFQLKWYVQTAEIPQRKCIKAYSKKGLQ